MLNESLLGQTSRPWSWLAAMAFVLVAQIGAARLTYERETPCLDFDQRALTEWAGALRASQC